ncbi:MULTISPECIES: phage antirepressor [Butyricimonas]|uniref:phage antirepressor n=1 Tax=Butyricimonas TaxID=574697 RepID=UPI0009F5E435|nr:MULTISPECIES: phage antirepressor KilAC domain-containing protein [Butyricimonas]
MENNIQLFKNDQFGEERVTELNGEPLFCLSDVCNILGLRQGDVRQRLDEGVVSTQPLQTAGGIQQANFVNEDGLYDTILDSRKQEAKQFRKWVTSEILPSIRKTGGYLVTSENDTPEMIMAKAIIVAQETIKKKDEKLKQLEHRNSILEPKAELMDKVMDSDQKIDVGQAAKILQLPFGRNTLFQKLREKGVFFSNRNEPKQEYIKRGYFELKEKWIDRDNHDGFMVVKVLVTQKGLDFIAKLFEIVKHTKQLAKIM